MMKNNIRNIWLELESDTAKDFSRTKLTSIQHLTCYVGSVYRTGARFFQIEVEDSVQIPKNILQRFSGLEIQVLPNRKDSTQDFSIFLLEKQLIDVFTLFVEDIIEQIKPLSEPEKAIAIINDRINYWKKLFAQVTGELLSFEKQRGLFGELHLLELLLNKAGDKKTILDSWTGPTNSNQDFAIDMTAIETKTSKAGRPIVHISNEHQLDFTQWKNLFLCLITVHETSGKKNTLKSIIQQIISLLEPDWSLRELFLQKLTLIGLPKESIDLYDQITYVVRNVQYFRIANGFPLIIPSMINTTEAFNVKYQIDTRNCQPFEIEENEALRHYYESNNK